MLRYLLDTDHLTLHLHGHSEVTRRVTLHTGLVGISVVTVEEILCGRLAQIARAGDGPTRIFSYSLLMQALQFDPPAALHVMERHFEGVEIDQGEGSGGVDHGHGDGRAGVDDDPVGTSEPHRPMGVADDEEVALQVEEVAAQDLARMSPRG